VRDAVRIPMYGCDCYAYGLLAAGLCDLVVEADLKPYDYMALVPIIQVGAGCRQGWGKRCRRLCTVCAAMCVAMCAAPCMAARGQQHPQGHEPCAGA
jgi:fructose-1,6-bisphosphatase/inositol monophosphatase family enzyme